MFKQKTPAEFFLSFKETAGLSNPMKVLYMTVREFTENSLDACEMRGILPDISAEIRKVEGHDDWYEVKVKDNGIGIPNEQIPKAFGTLLFSSKYELRMSRGIFGLGGKLCLLFGSSETGQPFKVISSVGDGKAYGYSLKINPQKNEPIILNSNSIKTNWRGTIVSCTTRGDMKKALPLLQEYFAGLSLINPYVNLRFIYFDFLFDFKRITSMMPKIPEKIKPHPKSITRNDLLNLMSLHKDLTLEQFFYTAFHRVGKRTAQKLLKFTGLSNVKPSQLSEHDINVLYVRMQTFNEFFEPDVNCLSLLEKTLFSNSIKSRFQPFLDSYAMRTGSYAGIPFAVEVEVAYGGKIKSAVDGEFEIVRFANRTPLLTDAKDLIYNTILGKGKEKGMNFNYYKIGKDSPIMFFVHLASVKIPYKSQGKESIAEVDEIEKALHNALVQALSSLSRMVGKQHRHEMDAKRGKVLAKYLTITDRFTSQSINKPQHNLLTLFPDLFREVGVKSEKA